MLVTSHCAIYAKYYRNIILRSINFTCDGFAHVIVLCEILWQKR